jgi:hypothetical protein
MPLPITATERAELTGVSTSGIRSGRPIGSAGLSDRLGVAGVATPAAPANFSKPAVASCPDAMRPIVLMSENHP